MSERRVTPPPGAWGADRQSQNPTPGHAAVVVVSLVLAAVLITASGAIGGGGLLTLLVLLLGVFALVMPVAIAVTLWRPAGPPVRALLALDGAVCVVLLVLAVVRILAVVPALLA